MATLGRNLDDRGLLDASDATGGDALLPLLVPGRPLDVDDVRSLGGPWVTSALRACTAVILLAPADGSASASGGASILAFAPMRKTALIGP